MQGLLGPRLVPRSTRAGVIPAPWLLRAQNASAPHARGSDPMPELASVGSSHIIPAQAGMIRPPRAR